MKRLFILVIIAISFNTSANGIDIHIEQENRTHTLISCLNMYVEPRLFSEDTYSLVDGAFRKCETVVNYYLEEYPEEMKARVLNDAIESLILVTDSRKRNEKKYQQ